MLLTLAKELDGFLDLLRTRAAAVVGVVVVVHRVGRVDVVVATIVLLKRMEPGTQICDSKTATRSQKLFKETSKKLFWSKF